MIENVFTSIKKGLEQKPIQQIKDPRKYAQIIAENGLIGVIYEQLPLDTFSNQIKGILTKYFYQYVSKDTKELIVINHIKEMLNQEKYPYIFLKGAHFKHIYPKSYMRGMGDIDLLVKQKDFKHVKNIFKKNGFKLISKYLYHDTYESPEGIQIELHPFIKHEFKTSYGDFFEDPFDHSRPHDKLEYRFEPAYELTYLLYHLDKHVHFGGIGIRSILDIYLFYTTQNIDQTLLKTYLEETGLLTFFESIINIHLYYFNEKMTSIFDFNKLSKNDIEEITTYFMKSGIHGRAANHDVFKSAIASKQNQSPLKYLFKVLFPSYKKVSARNSVIKYVPILLPFYWLLRILKLIVFKTKSSFSKLKMLSTSQEDEKNMFDKLNL